MRRGDIYRIPKISGNDPTQFRYYVIVSRDILIDSKFSSVVCAPIYSTQDGLSSQVAVGIHEGLKHDSSIHCDALMSLPKVMLTHYTGRLSSTGLQALNQALLVALALGID